MSCGTHIRGGRDESPPGGATPAPLRPGAVTGRGDPARNSSLWHYRRKGNRFRQLEKDVSAGRREIAEKIGHHGPYRSFALGSSGAGVSGAGPLPIEYSSDESICFKSETFETSDVSFCVSSCRHRRRTYSLTVNPAAVALALIFCFSATVNSSLIDAFCRLSFLGFLPRFAIMRLQ